MAYQMLTRSGRNFYEATSIMQNAIRNGNFDVAGNCMWELLPKYTSYLRKRLLVISAEDCFGVITKEIEALCNIGTEDALTKALSIMCKAKKNRDADFFVCNLMFNDNPSGESIHIVSQLLTKAVIGFDIVEAGNYSAELYKRSRKDFWKTLETLSTVYYPYLAEETRALARANEAMTKPAEEGIFGAKAIVLMLSARSSINDLLAVDGMDFYQNLEFESIEVPKTLDCCTKVSGYYPRQYYNWHTSHGRYDLRLDTIHATENDQMLLKPLKTNLFDDCSWNRDLTECLKRWNPHNRPIPYDDGKISAAEKYGKKK